MTLEQEIKMLSDFLDSHSEIPQRYEIYCEMRDDIYNRYGIKEVEVLSIVLKYRNNHNQ